MKVLLVALTFLLLGLVLSLAHTNTQQAGQELELLGDNLVRSKREPANNGRKKVTKGRKKMDLDVLKNQSMMIWIHFSKNCKMVGGKKR